MLTKAWHGPNPKGLAEVAGFAKTHVKAATLTGAAIAEHSYTLTFHAPAGAAARERALDEMERALNAYRIDTADSTGIDLRFE